MRADPILRHWPLVALVAAVAMLATAHGFETFGGYAPCTLCLRQREVYWAAIVVAAAGWALGRIGKLSPPATPLILGVLFLAGAVVAAYHAGAEWKWWPGPTSCSGAGRAAVGAADLTALLNGAKVRPPACDEAAWRLLGVSMAGWNGLISLGLACLSLAAAYRRERRA